MAGKILLGIRSLLPKGLVSKLDQPPERGRCLHWSSVRRGLTEFFDEKENWDKTEVRVGRAWKKEELRIKSNEDLHKLWFVLLKERNMLLTMDHEYTRNTDLMPSPERIDKVQESMVHLEDVVRERNRAYHYLETGQSGERPARLAYNQLGMAYWYKTSEHVVPSEMNKRWWSTRKLWFNRKECSKFLSLYREKIFLEKRKQRIRERNHVMQLLKRYPEADVSAIKEEFPAVDVERVKRWKKARGHTVPPDSHSPPS